ncbi:uncharacterized protein LOC134193120 isoform X2 [Corticium candelabrum]|uniref:uncharacterized protein LOC134193120 isoform X2 n=1 Tax=Corticium candelabrum TaxID=121492 RepID=UPI002E252CFF|nr:uncharacterized protein LOC134193120 isoform X2 [Corticium candelabrum]
MDAAQIDERIRIYYQEGKPLKVILAYLAANHVVRSMSWLKRKTRVLGLRRRNCSWDLLVLPDILQAMQIEIERCGRGAGYRSLWKRLKDRHGLAVRRDILMTLLSIMDPEGAKSKKDRRLKRRVYVNEGPNYVWHTDGYDKFSSFGIYIHSCIDGYSRKILWMKISPTNKDPSVVAEYYLDVVGDIGGCPRVLRSDHGTENCHLATAQITFRFYGTDALAADRSFRYGNLLQTQE